MSESGHETTKSGHRDSRDTGTRLARARLPYGKDVPVVPGDKTPGQLDTSAGTYRLFGRMSLQAQTCVQCQVGQGRNCACREAQAIIDSERPKRSSWSPAVNVLLILALFAAVKLKLVFAAVVLAGLTGWAVWRAVA